MQFLFWILDVRVNEEGVRFAVDVLDCDLEAIEEPGLGGRDFGGEVAASVLNTIPSEAAKNVRTWEMKWRLVSDSLTRSVRSTERSISSAVQKEVLAQTTIN